MKKLMSITLAFALLVAPNINGYAQVWKNRSIHLDCPNGKVLSGSMINKDAKLTYKSGKLERDIKNDALTPAAIERKQKSLKKQREKLEKRAENLNKEFQERVDIYVSQGWSKEKAQKKVQDELRSKYFTINILAICFGAMIGISPLIAGLLLDNDLLYSLFLKKGPLLFGALTLVFIFIPTKADAATPLSSFERELLGKYHAVLNNPFAFTDMSVEDMQTLFEMHPYAQEYFNNTVEVFENMDKYGVYPARENPECAAALEKVKFKDFEDFVKKLPEECKPDFSSEMHYAANWYRENGAALDAELQKTRDAAVKTSKNAVRQSLNNNKQIEIMQQRGLVHSYFD